MTTNEEIFTNRANAKTDETGTPVAENVTCETCNETMVFAMRDNYHEFSIGLSTILRCLEAAEKEGAVPKLPPEWWWKLQL